MGKQKQKKPQAEPAPQEPNLIDKIEDSVAGTAQGLSSTVQTHKTTLIAIGVVIIALIPIVYIVESVQTQQMRKQSGAIEEALEGEPAEVRSKSTDLLKQLEGKALEPVMALRFGQWLANEQDDRAEALRIAKDAATRHPDDLFLNEFIANLNAAIEADQGFSVPAPPETVGPIPEADDTGSVETSAEASAGESTITVPTTTQPTTQPNGG